MSKEPEDVVWGENDDDDTKEEAAFWNRWRNDRRKREASYKKLQEWGESGDRTAEAFYQLCIDMGDEPEWSPNNKLHETFNEIPVGELIKIEAMFDGRWGMMDGTPPGRVAEILFNACGEQNSIANDDDPIDLATLDEEHFTFLCTLMKNNNNKARCGGDLFASYCNEIPEEEEEKIMRIIWENAKSKKRKHEEE